MAKLLTGLRALLAKLKAFPLVQKVVLTFVHAFAGVFLLGITGVLGSLAKNHNLSTLRDAVVALVVASVLAGVHAVQHVVVVKTSKPKA